MDVFQETENHLVGFYSRFPVAIVRGHEHWVWDINEKKYLDFTSGLSVANFGHANPRVSQAIVEQVDKISHISNLFVIPNQAKLAQRITEKAFTGKVFFSNSGAEANEAALKMARIWGNQQRAGKNKVLALVNSFHGRTIATISITGQEKYKKGFEPLMTGVDFVEINNTADLEKKFDDDVCCIFMEALQAEGGIYMLSDAFVKKVVELSEKHHALIVFDEVQCGMGRTGRYFGYQNYAVEPDIISIAKALGNGFPIGATLVKNVVADSMPKGMHASTFGGNYVACEVGLAVMELMNDALLAKIRELSEAFRSSLAQIKTDFPSIIKENRIYGLFIGIDLDDSISVGDIINALIAKGVLTVRAGKNVLRLLPPFTITEQEIEMFCMRFVEVLKEIK